MLFLSGVLDIAEEIGELACLFIRKNLLQGRKDSLKCFLKSNMQRNLNLSYLEGMRGFFLTSRFRHTYLKFDFSCMKKFR